MSHCAPGMKSSDKVGSPEGSALIYTECYGSSRTHRYLEGTNGSLVCERHPTEHGYRSLRDFFVSLLLPHGYPDSVSKDYLAYQLWDTVQAFSSSVTGSLATQSLLRGSGVGDSTATVAAATITWILRDGTGMVGRILFAWMKGLFADLLNDIAIFMEIMAPVFPSFFTLTVCAAGVFKCIVGVAGGATRAAITVHQAKRDNMADVCAKDGSQETLVNLAGLLISLFLVPLVSDSIMATYLLFFLLTSLHLYANYRAVQSVIMETLNQSRLSIVLHHYLTEGKMLDPEAANLQEPLLPGLGSQASVSLGVPLNYLVSSVSELEQLKKDNRSLYLLGWRKDTGGLSVVLHEEASSVDMIRACVHAEMLYRETSSSAHHRSGRFSMQNMLSALQLVRGQGSHHCTGSEQDGRFVALEMTHDQIDRMFPKFLQGLTASGWVTNRNLLDSDDWRANWHVKKQQ
ncbi:RUS family member 1 isoform X2 [Xenopus laevis]|uniref:RUS family member 1 isoform X2 n=1 Tax=Xenopus laevis TaxID=8355 RepID=A0A8J1LSW9_XENLA|nr:RUS family member 1 isoform X2 [Xenopus laevis]